MTDPAPRVIAFGGRRIDPDDAQEHRFPPDAETAVARRLRKTFERAGADTIIASAACGADIIALEVAADLDMHRRVVLPFDRDTFRESSVTDRPGDWGARYDAILDSLDAGDVTILRLAGGAGAYDRASNAILDLAVELAGRPAAVLCVIAWNGQPRGDDDVTARFAQRARSRGIPVEEVDTSRPGSKR